MVLTVLEITAPAFLLAAAGFFWAKKGLPYDTAFVTRLGTGLAVPCLIFSTLARTEIEPGALARMLGSTLLLYALFWLVFGAGLKLAGLPLRVFLPPTAMNNSGNLGLPICLYAFGPEGLALGIVLFAAMVIIQFSFGVWYVSGQGRLRDAAKQPMIWSAVLGVAAAALQFRPPTFLDNAIGLAGQMAIPLMVLTLGVSIATIRARSVARAAAISTARFVAAGAIALGVGRLLGLEGLALSVLVLQSIMPAPVTNYLLALKFDAHPEEVASLVVVSTVLSIVFIPLALALIL